MNKYATHEMRHFRDNDTQQLIRRSDGMVIAVRSGNLVAFGEDPRKQTQHVFADVNYAKAFMRSLGDRDIAKETGQPNRADFEDTEGGSRVLTPDDLLGGVRPS